jgi:hypothetical protein
MFEGKLLNIFKAELVTPYLTEESSLMGIDVDFCS